MSKDSFTPNDFFGERPERPSHDDFWKLSEIVLGLDASMEDAKSGADVEEIIAKEAARIGDPYSITYMATQRAMRVHEVANGHDLMAKIDDVSRTATVYLEGMIVGARFKKAKDNA